MPLQWRTMSKAALILVPLLVLAGCASMSASQCRVADWEQVGFDDAARGESDARLASYADDCAQAGVSPDVPAYRRGWNRGILTFCTAQGGWREGLAGRSGKEAMCRGRPGYLAFSRHLESGLQVYRLNEQIRRNDVETQRLQRQLERSADDRERQRLRSQLRDIDGEQFRLRRLLGEQRLLAP
jgi:hypothetical protein